MGKHGGMYLYISKFIFLEENEQKEKGKAKRGVDEAQLGESFVDVV